MGKLIGGRQREEDLDVLLAAIKEHDLPMSEFEWYLDLRRFGSVPRGGFDLGLKRMVGWAGRAISVVESGSSSLEGFKRHGLRLIPNSCDLFGGLPVLPACCTMGPVFH